MNSLYANPISTTSLNTQNSLPLPKLIILKIGLFLLLLSSCTASVASRSKPRLTVIIAIDSLAYDAVQRYHTYFRYGFHKLITQGVNYTNAYHPHGMPATATGHAALSTGTYAKDHGIINNSWFDAQSNLIKASGDSAQNAAVFSSSTDTYNYGISSRNLMTTTLSDQFTLQSTECSQRYAYALCAKGHDATQMAGKQGKAIWFDKNTGNFTSSKAYFDTLPRWLTCFNTTQALNQLKQVTWCLAKPCNSNCYKYIREHVTPAQRLCDTVVPIEWDTHPKNPFQLFLQTPHANQLVFDLAKACIDAHISKKNENELLL